MNRKGNFFFNQTVFLSENSNVLRYQKLQHVFECCLLALAQPHNNFATRLLPCRRYVVRSRPMQKSAVHVCKVATVVIETTHLVLSQFKNFYYSQWIIEYGISVPKIISKRYELMKLCDINCSGPVF